jgi:hypothetical protein
MTGQHTRFEDTCEIVGIKNGIGVTGEILTFRKHEVIVATINRSVKVKLQWNEHAELYVGSVGGVEFQSVGPKSQTYRTTR